STSTVYHVDVNEGRSLPNVLKRISNLLALKSSNLQDYADSELKQYWMPDSVSKKCYECCEKFTTFRRRHHCRSKFGSTALSPTTAQQDSSAQNLKKDSLEVGNILRRKIPVGYQEEKFALGQSNIYLTTKEKCKALQNSVSVRVLFEEISRSTTGIPLGTQRYRLRTYTDCFLGSELVDWLIYQQKTNTRIQAAAICQALLKGAMLNVFLTLVLLLMVTLFINQVILYLQKFQHPTVILTLHIKRNLFGFNKFHRNPAPLVVHSIL
ncbi:DEP and/or FYVE domain containing protein, partial [Asbolus verrucosus]